MVTGVETAGLVLASFPLVVNGLTRYVDGVQTIRYWRRFRRELASYARKLENQRVWYLDTLEELFDGIVQSNDELAALVNDPVGPSWKKAGYEKQLRMRLGQSYDHYLDTLADIVATLEDMRDKLGVQAPGKDLWKDYSAVDREMKRLKMVLSRGIYAEMLDKIDKANKDLREYTHQNIRLEPTRRRRRAKRLLADFKLIRRYATSLYKVIVAGQSWTCGCKSHHTASLRLEPRPRRLNDCCEGDISKVKFRILLSKSKPGDEPYIYSEWRELEVEPVEIDTSQSHSGLSNTPHNSNSPKLSERPLQQSSAVLPAKKRVRFSSPAGPPGPNQTSPARNSASSNLGPITDICTTVHYGPVIERNIGFLSDDGLMESRHYLSLVDDARRHPIMHIKSLDGLLEDSQYGSIKPRFSRRDRLCVAATLASSVLQLDETLWMKRQWKSSDIFFYYQEGHAMKKSEPCVTEPYLSWKPGKVTNRPGEPPPLKAHLVHSEALFALGLTLIELCFGKTLSMMQEPDDVDSNEAITRLNAARRLLDQVYDECGGSYGDVVRRCLFCPFDVRDASLDNDEFQEAVFDHIVTPLINDLNVFNGSGSIK